MVIDLTYLELRNGNIYIGGTSAGNFLQYRAGDSVSEVGSTPVNSSDAERVLALYSGKLRVTPLECRPF